MRRSTSRQRRHLLEGLSLFSGCTPEELRNLESLTSLHEAPRGAVLVEEGAPGHEFFVIVEGSATVTHGGTPIARLDAGSFFGEMALLDGRPRTASVVADTDMTLIVLSPGEFRALETSAPMVVARLLSEVGVRLRRLTESFDPAPGRPPDPPPDPPLGRSSSRPQPGRADRRVDSGAGRVS